MIFVDANFLVRVLVEPQDDYLRPSHEVASAFLRRSEREGIEFTTSDAILAEVAFILESKKHYGVSAQMACELIATILHTRGFRHPEKRTLFRALDIWRDHPRIGFVDALTAAYVQSQNMLLASFDSDFDPLPGIRRWTPD